VTTLRVVVALAVLWLAAVWQLSMVGQGYFLGVRLEPALLVLTLVSLRVRPALGAAYGFLCGLVQGGAAGADLTALALSRTLVGFAVSWVASSDVQFVPVVTGIVALAATVAAQLALMFVAPPPDIGGFLAATLGSAIYNGVVAGLIDAFLRRTLDPKVD
jgi:hypothetical protein